MRFKKLIISAIILLIFINLFPIWEQPHFRYTGSSIERNVLNLGLPFAHLIIDFNCAPYIFIGPTMYVLIPFDLLGIVILIAIVKKRKKQK
ncbi:hypothetical protein ACFL9U_16840 [Thermodesulfobacteriota bacterium]